LLGYLGAMPVWVDKKIEAGWLTCMWVSPKARGRGLAGKMLLKMNDAYQGKVLLGDFVPGTERVYLKTGAFTGPLAIQGLRLYFRSDAQTILPARDPKWKKFSALLQFADTAVNSITDLRFLFSNSEPPKFSFPEKLNESERAFIDQHQKKFSFSRDHEDLQWMYNNPWVLSGDPDDPINSRYRFSAIDKYFKNYFLKLEDESGRVKAILLLIHRNDHLKVPHAYFEKRETENVASVLVHLIIEWKINTCTLFHKPLVDHFRSNPGSALFQKNISRCYIFSKGFSDAVDIHSLRFQDGDGDVGFT